MSTIILSDVTAFIAALLFAVHPIHTEAVSITTQKNCIINSHSNIQPNMHLLFVFAYVHTLFSCSFSYFYVVNVRHQTMTFKEPENLIFLRHESNNNNNQQYNNKKGKRIRKEEKSSSIQHHQILRHENEASEMMRWRMRKRERAITCMEYKYSNSYYISHENFVMCQLYWWHEAINRRACIRIRLFCLGHILFSYVFFSLTFHSLILLLFIFCEGSQLCNATHFNWLLFSIHSIVSFLYAVLYAMKKVLMSKEKFSRR